MHRLDGAYEKDVSSQSLPVVSRSTDCQQRLDEAFRYFHLALEATPHPNLQRKHESLQRLQIPGIGVGLLKLLPPCKPRNTIYSHE